MVFFDLIEVPTPNNEVNTMHAEKVSHKILFDACAWMHTHRLNALQAVVQAAIAERRLSVTGLGRAIDSEAKEKHCIKQADRLIGNTHLHRDYRDVYASFARLILGPTTRPVILVDWSDLDGGKNHFLLRASVAVDGRALTLYEEVHELSTKEKPATHRTFLGRLKRLIPESCQPIMVSDAGFRNPWFRAVEEIGWDWVGRVRNRTQVYKVTDDGQWRGCKVLYGEATTTARYLGQYDVSRSSPLAARLVLYKAKAKGRSKITAEGTRAKSKVSEQCAQREREPWLLATSLPVSSKLAKKVVAIYRTRMQIEEAFRDTKSVRFGVGYELSLSRSAERIQILFLIAMIANVVLWVLGMAAYLSGQQRHYQANTERKRRVLSFIYLGLCVANDRRLRFSLNELEPVGTKLYETLASHGEGW